MRHGILKLVFFYLILSSSNLHSEPIEGSFVEVQILDKITAKVKSLDINVNEIKFFETLQIEVYTCFKNPPEQIPENYVLLKIFDNVNSKENKLIYQGWMISSSPATTPLEHPIYDFWLINCKI